ncbi:MAG: lasso peptide biosynthesis B2 protein [Spirochaetes bacterium]|nr:lasso peptide biosynthesis B2 protein [Spirochaetota bacterium]
MIEITGFWIMMSFFDIRLNLIPDRWNTKLLFSDQSLQKNLEQPELYDQSLQLREYANRVIRLVRISSRYHLFFNMSCLRRSLVIKSHFQKRGYPARLVYGAGSQRTAHAWVEIGTFQIDSSSNPAGYKIFQ